MKSMRSLALKREPTPVLEDAGTVVSHDGSTFVVRTDTAVLRAHRAVSCLVAPEALDHVLVACVGDDCYVLAVLRREAGAKTSLTVDGDLQLNLPAGRFDVAASEGVRVASGKDVAVVSTGVSVFAEHGAVTVGTLAVLGAAVVAEVERVKVVAGALESVVERAVQRVKRSFRFVDGLDQVKAESIDYRADRSLNLQGENTVLTAQELVKVDGSQIHVG